MLSPGVGQPLLSSCELETGRPWKLEGVGSLEWFVSSRITLEQRRERRPVRAQALPDESHSETFSLGSWGEGDSPQTGTFSHSNEKNQLKMIV